MLFNYPVIIKNWKTIFLLLLFIDVMILISHILLGSNWIFFHLDFENNLPTFYQSTKLIIFGTLFLFASLTKKISFKFKTFLIPLSLVLMFVGLDELFQIHENIYRIFEYTSWFHPAKVVTASYNRGYRSSLWILYYLPLFLMFIVWSVYWFRYFQKKVKNNLKFILLINFLILLIVLTEILSSMGTFSPAIYYVLVTLEESAEMFLASFLVLIGLILTKNFSQNKSNLQNLYKTHI